MLRLLYSIFGSVGFVNSYPYLVKQLFTSTKVSSSWHFVVVTFWLANYPSLGKFIDNFFFRYWPLDSWHLEGQTSLKLSHWLWPFWAFFSTRHRSCLAQLVESTRSRTYLNLSFLCGWLPLSLPHSWKFALPSAHLEQHRNSSQSPSRGRLLHVTWLG